MAIIQNPNKDEFQNHPCHAIFEKQILVCKDNSIPSFSVLSAFSTSDFCSEFFYEKDFDILVMHFSKNPSSEEFQNLSLHFITVREYFSFHQEDEIFKAARARALALWKSGNKFCPKCAAPLALHKTLTALECPDCKIEYFPRIEPCIIVLVTRKNGNQKEMLLVRHVQRNQDIFACIAGFIEAGETVEQAVHREVREETGIEIKNLCYKGSQGWPFPDQLMLAFTAEYKNGEISLQKSEIAEYGWFTQENIPKSPKPGSVAYRLIHDLF